MVINYFSYFFHVKEKSVHMSKDVVDKLFDLVL